MKFPIGGQAVIEGVMLRKRKTLATAVRNPKGKIIVKKEKFNTNLLKNKFFRAPIIRGIITFFETIVLGMKIISYSSNIALGEEEEQLSSKEIAISIILALLMGIGVFKFLPYLSATFLSKNLGLGTIIMNLSEAVIKLIIFSGYLALIGLMPDIKRLYQYHGAEHKTVNCYEAGKKMSVANIKKFTKRQPRCGTTFVIMVFLVSILFYVFIPITHFWLAFTIRIALLPVIAGLTYELIKIISKYYDKSKLIQIAFIPGLLFQDITTKEPDNKQIEVALEAFKALVPTKK